MNKKTNSLLITSLVLLLMAGAVIYFLDMPQYQKMQQGIIEIENLKKQKDSTQSYNLELVNAAKNLEEGNWIETRKKIEMNSSADPFYASKMEVFFKDIISRSGMALTSLGFSSSSGASGEPSKTPPAGSEKVDAKKTPTENVSANIKKTESLKINVVTLSVTGTYEQLKALLKIFEKQAYLISIDSINFSGSTATTSFSINSKIYSY